MWAMRGLSGTAQGEVALAEQDRAGHGGASGGRRLAQGGFSRRACEVLSQNCKGLKILDVVPSVAAFGTATASATVTAIAY